MSRERLASEGLAGKTITNYLDDAIYFGFHALILSIPLAFLTSTYDVFDLVKVTVLRIEIILLLLFWVAKQVFSEQVSVRRTELDFPILAFLVLAGISTITSVHLPTSILGTTGRYEGLLTIVIYGLLFFLVVQNLSTRARISALQTTMVATSVIIAIYGLAQFLGYDFFEWKHIYETGRASSTLGNPIFLAGYLVLVFPVSLAKYIESAKPLSKVFFGAATLLILAAVVTTFSRGGWIALVFGLVALMLIWGKKALFSRKMALLLLVFILVFSAIFLINQRAVSSSPKGAISLSERVVSMPRFRQGSIYSRLLIWKGTLRMIAERPLLGWGPDTFWLVFPRLGGFELTKTVSGSEFPDNAHNYFLQLAGTIGLLGLLSFVVILTFALRQGGKLLLVGEANRILFGGLLAGILAYVVHIQSSINVIGSGTIFWLAAGLLFTQSEKPGSTWSVSLRTSSFQKIAVSVFLVLLAVAGSAFSLRPLLADMHFARAERMSILSGDFNSIVHEYEMAIRLNPYESQYASKMGRFYASQLEKTGNGQLFARGVLAFRTAIEAAPLDPYNHALLGSLYLFGGENFDPSYYPAAEQELRRSLELQPFWSPSHSRLGLCYLDTGRVDKAAREFELATRFDPRSIADFLLLGGAYEILGKEESAAKAFVGVTKLDPNNEQARKALQRIKDEGNRVNAK